MASLEQVNEALGKVVAFLAPLVPLIGCHMVDFLTLEHWDTLLPPQLQQDLLNLPSDALHMLPSAALPHTPDDTTQGNDEPWHLSSSDLSSFLSQVRRHCPAALGVTTLIEQVLGEYGSAEINILAMKGIMSHKKTHEVDTMAQVIARLAKGLGVRWLVDLGSGRGYLSTSLVLQYSQSVVAIDSSSANTTSALVRNAKLKRWWDNLRQTWLDKAEGRPVKKGKKTRRKKTPTSPQLQQEQQQEQVWRQDDQEEDRTQENKQQENINQEYRKQENISQEDRKQENRSQEGMKQGKIIQENKKQENTVSQKDNGQEEKTQKDKRKEDITPQNRVSSGSHATHHIGCYIGVTKFITEDTDLLEVVRSAVRTDKVTEKSRNRDESGAVKNDSGLGLEDTVDHYTSSHTTSIYKEHITTTSKNTHTRKQPPDVNTIDFCSSSHVTSTTHTNAMAKNTNTRQQAVDRGNSTDYYNSSPTISTDTTHINTTTKNTSTREPPPDIAKTTDHCTSSLTTSIDTTHISIAIKNTNTKTPPPSPPDSQQEPTTTCMVDDISSLGLVGLHTCGNLASSSLRLFMANPRVAFLCNVGCCYHLLEEEFSRNTYNQQKTQLDKGKPFRLSQKEECVSRCKEEREVLVVIEQGNDALRSSTGYTQQVGQPAKLTHKEESVRRCGEKKGILVVTNQENDALRSSTGHTQQVGQLTRTYKEESVRRCEEEKEILVTIKKESESLKSSTGHIEKVEKPARLTHSEEEGLPRSEEEKEVLVAIRQEGGALKSSTGHREQEKCRKDSLASVYKEESAQEHEDIEQSLALTKKDCKFSKSSTNHTEKKGKRYITGTTEFIEDHTSFTKEKEKEHDKNSPPYSPSSLLLQGHFPSTTKENYNYSLPAPSQPLQDHTVFSKEKEENHNSKSPLLPSTSSPLQGHSLPNTEEKGYNYNPSSSPPPPRTQEKGDKRDIDPLHPSRIPNLGHGFPLSTFLRDKRFSLGRNSRMLSSQAADRLTRGSIGGADSLYWRALLQVVLVDRLGDVSHLSHVGRLSAKCHTFPEYAQAALARLEVSLEVTEKELQEYDRRHSSSKGRLERFFLLRASLAAVVEGAVLLDRLAYLCEQDDVSAFLVQLFDPVTSPRSHALIAIRTRERSTPTTTLIQRNE